MTKANASNKATAASPASASAPAAAPAPAPGAAAAEGAASAAPAPAAGASSALDAVQALANSGAQVQAAALASDGVQALGKAALAGTRPALRVVSRPESFRRAGREFSREPVDIPAEELTEQQLEALENEPELVTTRVYLPADEAEGDDDTEK